jgi:hypothetical protein
VEILGDAAPDVPEANRRSQRRDPDLDLDLPTSGAGPAGRPLVADPGSPRGPQPPVLADAPEEYDVDEVPRPPDVPAGGPQGAGLVQAVTATLTSEALGLTGVLLVLAGVFGFPSPFLWAEYGAETLGYDPRDAAEFAGRATALLALLATGLGVVAVLRLGARPTGAGRALAGAAVLAGVLLLLYAAALLWHVSGMPPTPQVPQVP